MTLRGTKLDTFPQVAKSEGHDRVTAMRRSWGKIRKIGSGRYHSSYVSPIDGQRHNAANTYDSRMDAEAWLAAERRLIETDTWTPPAQRAQKRAIDSTTVQQYIERWIDERELAESTRELYRLHATKRIYPTLGQEPISGLSAARVRSWWAGMGNRYPTAKRHAYSVLRAAAATAVEDGILSDNPCRLELKAPNERDVGAITPEQLDTVAAEVHPHYRIAVHILAWTSVRFGELIELRRADIEDDGQTMKLAVRRGAARVGNTIVVGSTKTSRSKRQVTVPPHVADMIRAHQYDDLLVTTTRGERLTKAAFTRSLKKGYAKIGRPELRVHDLRAVGATFAAQAGATTKELMARLGHTTPRMAMKYQMASEARDEKIAQAMTALATQKSPPPK